MYLLEGKDNFLNFYYFGNIHCLPFLLTGLINLEGQLILAGLMGLINLKDLLAQVRQLIPKGLIHLLALIYLKDLVVLSVLKDLVLQ